MSQEGQINQENLNQPLDEKEVKSLIEKALNEGHHESMFILVLSEWNRPGSSFKDKAEFTVLYGEIETILLDHYYDYPTTDNYTYAIIPKTRTVVILFKWNNNYKGKLEEQEVLYIFSYSYGWKSIDLY